MIFGLVV